MRDAAAIDRIVWAGSISLLLMACIPSSRAAGTAPGEVTVLSWCSAAKDCLAWSAVPGASEYVVHRGGSGTLKSLLTEMADSCEAGRFASTSTGASLGAPSHAGTLFWYLVTAVNDAGEGPAGSGSAGPRRVNATGPCQTTNALEPGECSDSSECTGGAVCYEGLCRTGCYADGEYCLNDAGCCSGACVNYYCRPPCKPVGDPCIGAGGLCCSGYCRDGTCQPHCAPNGNSCGANDDCCSGYCDYGTCAQGCVPDGGYCSNSFQCCSGNCFNYYCRSSCTPPGGICSNSSQCCSYYCYAGHCY